MKLLEYKKIYQELPPTLTENDTVALDLELAGLKENQLHRPHGRFLSLAGSFDGESAYIIFDVTQIPEFMKRIEKATIVFHNSVFDLGHLKRWTEITERKNMRDTLLIERLLWSNYYSDFTLADLVRRYLKCYMSKDVRKEFHNLEGGMTWEQIEYAALDAIGTWLVDKEQQKIISPIDSKIWYNLYNPHVYTALELGGFSLDIEKWKDIAIKNQSIANEIEIELGKKYGWMESKFIGRGKNRTEIQEFVPFNPASPLQVLKVCKSLGLDIESTDDDTIRPYYDSNDFIKKILDYREASKQASTYGLDFLKYVEEDGRIYTSLNIGLATTGRDSSSSPNLQNIPTFTRHRECFIAGKGKKLILFDYSGQEANIFAYLTQDQKLIDIINSGKKLYIEIAREAFNETITKESPRYKVIKSLVLGLMYGLSVKGFAEGNGVDEETAQEMFNKFFDAYPAAHQYYKNTISRNRGVSKSILGRTSHLHPYDWKWKTNALNNPMQMCISGESLILTQEHGVIAIGAVNGQDIHVWDGENFVEASVAYGGKKKKVIVNFQNGQEIICSPEHRFLTINSAGSEKWRTAEEISKLQGKIWVKLSEESDNFSSNKQTSIPEKFDKKTANSHTEALANFTPYELGIWIGRLASDGTVTNRCVHLLVAEHEKEILEYMIGLTSKIFPPRVRTYVKESYAPMYRIDLDHAPLAQFLQEEKVKYRIPRFIFQDKETLRGYLCGMFDGDGTVNKDGAYLTFGENHKHLAWANDIAVALNIFGISSRVTKYADRITVRILKRDMPKFSSEIGFLSTSKQMKSEAVKPQAKKNEWGSIYGRSVAVKSVEITDEQIPMYDVVDSETEKFMVNGFITHNSAGDMIKAAMKRFRRTDFYKKYYPTKQVCLILQIHDEIIAEADEHLAEECAEVLKKCMIETAEMMHPGVIGNVSGGIIENWLEKE